MDQQLLNLVYFLELKKGIFFWATQHENGGPFDPPRAKARTQRVCGLDWWFKTLDFTLFKNARGLKAQRFFLNL